MANIILNSLGNSKGGKSVAPMVETTWSALKALRDGGQLVAGQEYRITDYVTTTSKSNTQSAGHAFDVIVTADSANTLNENARACLHNGDIYFSGNGADLSAWELKYSLDNETNRFEWADATNGKGVIYRMVDEWGNDVPYDFKNIQSKANDSFVYTFGGGTDDSLAGGSNGNVVGEYIVVNVGGYNKHRLNGNTFGTNCYNNIIGKGCYDLSFGNDCINNILGNAIENAVLGNECKANRFGNDCYFYFGDSCKHNVVENEASTIVFGNSCSFNSIGNGCSNITLGNNCERNIFDNYSNHYTLGEYCCSNTFGVGSNNNYFGASRIDIRSYCRGFVIENDVKYTFIDCEQTTSNSQYLQNVHICSGVAGTKSERKTITIPSANNTYLTYVYMNESGELTYEKSGEVLKKASDLETNKADKSTTYTKTEVDSKIGDIGAKCKNLVETTWSALKTLRDAGNLVAGQQYRITDYHCTTILEDTQSADHQFDIIVVADSANTLNENARACLHSGDTYFSSNGADLSAWELKYCLDNDTDRCQWADSENGKGVVFFMKDEWNNECYYDFKNIMFKRYKIDTCSKSPDLEGLYGIDGGQGYTIDDSTTYWCYTFCMIDNYDGESHDLSVEQKKYISDENIYYSTHDNKFSAYITNPYGEQTLDSYQLPNNVLVTDTDIACVEEDYSYGEFYGFYSNTFGNDCYWNTFGNDCYSNTFGNYCGNNTFGNGCYRNTFGNYCNSNTFGNGCYRNTFGNYCSNNTFGNDCYSNTFGNGCYSNTFGNYCGNNTFGNDCYSNTFGNYVRWCTAEDGVQNVVTSCSTGSSAYLQNMHILNGTQGVSSSNKLTISITANRAYCTFVGKNSSGTLKIWCPADAV